MVASVEEVSSSLVREYLSRNGLKRTIACMDEEHPRTETSINNRSQLRQILNIEDIYRKNKEQIPPLKTLLEIIVKHHIEQLNNDHTAAGKPLQNIQTIESPDYSPARKPSGINDLRPDGVRPTFVNGENSQIRSEISETWPSQPTRMSSSEKGRPFTSNPTDVSIYNSDYQEGQPPLPSLLHKMHIVQRQQESNSSFFEAAQKNRSNRIRRGMMTGPIPQESNRKRQSRRAEESQTWLKKEEGSLDGSLLFKSRLTQNSTASSLERKREFLNTPERNRDEESCVKTEQKLVKPRKTKMRSNASDLKVSEMVLDDIDDDDDDVQEVSLQRNVSGFHYSGCQMDHHSALELKNLLLASNLNSFSSEWMNQGFTFSETHDLRYGIVQRKGGPCGVLASIQAFVLKKLLFDNTDSTINNLHRLRPSNSTRRQCLVSALAEVLWKAGEKKQATVAVISGPGHFTISGHHRCQAILEKMMLFSVDSFKDLQFIVEQQIEQFESGKLGCVLLAISAILSRSTEKVREDMDVPTTTLIGAHGYCTQELINLLLCGRAVSNVFDNDIELDSGNGNVTLLKGVKDPCEVGLLSLFEHYNICKVGAYLKSPSYPIWVVCSESHFSVLFGLQRELLTNQDDGLEFDLYFYDGLANQQEEIRLTISVGKSAKSSQQVDADLTPPLELCIQTRWKDASVNWNGTEPLL
uniref:Ubiquitin carboxyl-terminal hydrolase MINDY n=1 Tax=Nothobranchius kadleci TaxID=1051664 RepID=A0A1A8EAR4_NOTKA